jgi:hypothetical protein
MTWRHIYIEFIKLHSLQILTKSNADDTVTACVCCYYSINNFFLGYVDLYWSLVTQTTYNSVWAVTKCCVYMSLEEMGTWEENICLLNLSAETLFWAMFNGIPWLHISELLYCISAVDELCDSLWSEFVAWQFQVWLGPLRYIVGAIPVCCKVLMELKGWELEVWCDTGAFLVIHLICTLMKS